MKYAKMAKVNEMATLATQLSLEQRTSEFGISIITEDSAKFFPIDFVYLHPEECRKYIKSKAHPSLQTKFI